MKEQKIKETIIKDVREALLTKNEMEDLPLPTDSSLPQSNDPIVDFASRFVEQGGTMYYCADQSQIGQRFLEIVNRYGENDPIGCCNKNLTTFLQSLGLSQAVVATPDQQYGIGALLCEGLTSDNGSVIITDKQGFGVSMPYLPQVSILVAFTSQVLPNWDAVVNRLKEIYKTFPNQTWVIRPDEKTRQLTNLYLVLIDDEL